MNNLGLERTLQVDAYALHLIGDRFVFFVNIALVSDGHITKL